MSLKIVCIDSKNYLQRGAEYVDNLFDMISRNMSDGTLFDFTVFNDYDAIYNENIKIQKLPGNLIGWYNKLYLFKVGVFHKGDRIVFFDLDTVIVGDIENILKYDGDFACLTDFYHPGTYNSGVMSWRVGNKRTENIWNMFEMECFPDVEGGDQVIIEKWYKGADIWQILFPGDFVSYKVHSLEMFPKGAKIVCFHGEPRPHQVEIGWVPKIWKVGGGTTLELLQQCNTPVEEIIRNIKASSAANYPWLCVSKPHDEHAVIVGGGPSLLENIEGIKQRNEHGQTIFSTNNTWKILRDRGIKSHFHVMCDARQKNSEFVPTEDCYCLYASQCDSEIFKRAEHLNVTLWHSLSDIITDIIGKDREYALVGGGSTVGLKSMVIAYIMGYRNIHLYGFDSSYRGERHHAYSQNLNDGEKVIDVEINGEKFRAAPWMCAQVDEFKEVAAALIAEGVTLTVHGDGLLPAVARTMSMHAQDDLIQST